MPESLDKLESLSPRKRELFRLLLKERQDKSSDEQFAIAPRKKGESAPLSLAQLRLWVINELSPDSTADNLGGAYRLTGPLRPAALDQALTELFRRHDILRACFRLQRDEPVQIITPLVGSCMNVIELSHHRGASGDEMALAIALG